MTISFRRVIFCILSIGLYPREEDNIFEEKMKVLEELDLKDFIPFFDF
jgi:hypothetical protein